MRVRHICDCRYTSVKKWCKITLQHSKNKKQPEEKYEMKDGSGKDAVPYLIYDYDS